MKLTKLARVAALVAALSLIGTSLAFASDLGYLRSKESFLPVSVIPQEIADYSADKRQEETLQSLERTVIEDLSDHNAYEVDLESVPVSSGDLLVDGEQKNVSRNSYSGELTPSEQQAPAPALSGPKA